MPVLVHHLGEHCVVSIVSVHHSRFGMERGEGVDIACAELAADAVSQGTAVTGQQVGEGGTWLSGSSNWGGGRSQKGAPG